MQYQLEKARTKQRCAYQNFYTNAIQLIGLLKSDSKISKKYTQNLAYLVHTEALKINFQERKYLDHADELKDVALVLVNIANSNNIDHHEIKNIEKQIYNVFDDLDLNYRLSLFPEELKKYLDPSQFIETLPSSQKGHLDSLYLGLPLGFGLLFSGMIFFAIFFPLTWSEAIKIGIAPSELYFFTWYPDNYNGNLISVGLSAWLNPSYSPISYAMGTLYGFAGIACSVWYLSFVFNLNRVSFLDIITKIFGVYLAFYLTYLVASVFFEWLEFELFNWTLSIKLWYIFLCFFFFEGLKYLSKSNSLKNIKYEVLFDGLFALFSSFILIKMFESKLAETFSGPLFLLCMFVGFLIAEQTIARFYFAYFEIAKDLDNKKNSQFFYLDLLKKTIADFYTYFKNFKGQKNFINEEKLDIKKLFKNKEFLRIILPSSIFIFLISLTWPILLSLIYSFIIL